MSASKPIKVSPFVRIHERCPDDIDASEDSKSTYRLRKGDFIAKPKTKTQNKSHERYLIVGFDTEFKVPDEDVERDDVIQGKARYRVLSYQFHCSTDDGKEWSGIGCPDDEERISLAELLIFALGKGIADGHVTHLPTRIYLVGHFTRADVPAFSDFKTLQTVISAVRNTFASIDGHISIDLAMRGGDNVRLQVYLRDTMLLTPGSTKSLAAIGDLVNRPKIVLHPDAEIERRMKGRMDELRRNDWELFKKYALNDAVICVDYLKQIIAVYQQVTGEAKVPVTLTSIGVELLLKTWGDAGLDKLAVLGREIVNEEKWDRRLGHYKQDKREVAIEECHWQTDFVTETYHGGRNEQFWFGPCYEADWTDYDLAGAYPTAMSLIGNPRWREFRFSRDVQDFTPTTLGFACVDFEFPETVRYPTLPVRTQNGLVFPLKGRSYCAAPEIVVALELGAKITIRHGVIIPTDQDVRIFGSFIKECVAKRSLYPKNSLYALFWKEISNSTYGKTAQGLREKRVFDMRERQMAPLPPSSITNPFFASFITSFVRGVLGEIINALPTDVMVFSCTTDGFLTDATDEQIVAAQSGTLSSYFASSREWLTGASSVLEKKHQIRLPLGWRTRGQATLVAGTASNDPSYNVVLARGGISLPDGLTSTASQSEHICRLFFHRTPTDTITSTVLTGIRDMVEFDADLVPKKVTKRLSMEFDWKRRPHAVGTHPTYYDHIVFSTGPWQTVEQFQKVRELWTAFQKRRPRCITSIEELDRFNDYVQSVTMLKSTDRKRQTYLATHDPDLKRLRQMLCAAWHSKRAGITGSTLVHIDNQMIFISTAADFAKLLVRCGVPTKTSDVNNGRKKGFVPGNCPSTERCRDAVAKLRAFYPKLDDRELFASEASPISSLTVRGHEDCDFVARVSQATRYHHGEGLHGSTVF